MGLFGQMDEGESGEGESSSPGIKLSEDRRRKRWCPVLYSTEDVGCITSGTDDERPAKRIRRDTGTDHTIVDEKIDDKSTKIREDSTTLTSLPEDLLAHCLSFLGGVEDRYALQCTSQQFRRISNSDEMMIRIQVGGDKETGLNGIITEKDTPESAAANLAPFVDAGNLEAIYM